jgi:hypothetical protein
LQATFLVDSDSDAAKKTVLGNLANPDNTARFYSNAAAYTLNILNGPEVAPQVIGSQSLLMICVAGWQHLLL